MGRLRISRPCYDKYHRCPGWAGGGTRHAKIQRCDNGYLGAAYDRRLWRWRLTRYPACGVIVLPYMVRWLDWRYLWHWRLMHWISNRRYEHNYRKGEHS